MGAGVSKQGRNSALVVPKRYASEDASGTGPAGTSPSAPPKHGPRHPAQADDEGALIEEEAEEDAFPDSFSGDAAAGSSRPHRANIYARTPVVR
jgi:hypothetical protein